MRIAPIDAGLAAAAMLAIMLTVLVFLAAKGPAVDVRDITVSEITIKGPTE